MTQTASKYLTWFPRILAFLFAGFISIFALDSFEGHHSILVKIGYFIIHLIPSLTVLAVLGLAWHRRIIGGLVFMVLGMVFTIYFGTWRKAALFLIFSIPLFVTGVGFIFSRYSQLTEEAT